QPLLTPDCMAVLDRLLVPEEETGKTPLYLLRQYATSNTPPALLETLDKLTLLHSWAVDQWDMTALNPNRQKFLARLGRKYTVQALRRMGPERRYPILLALLKQTLIDLTDESIDIFDVCLASRHKKAREALKPTFKGSESPFRFFVLRALHTTRSRGPAHHRAAGDRIGHH